MDLQERIAQELATKKNNDITEAAATEEKNKQKIREKLKQYFTEETIEQIDPQPITEEENEVEDIKFYYENEKFKIKEYTEGVEQKRTKYLRVSDEEGESEDIRKDGKGDHKLLAFIGECLEKKDYYQVRIEIIAKIKIESTTPQGSERKARERINPEEIEKAIARIGEVESVSAYVK